MSNKQAKRERQRWYEEFNSLNELNRFESFWWEKHYDKLNRVPGYKKACKVQMRKKNVLFCRLIVLLSKASL